VEYGFFWNSLPDSCLNTGHMRISYLHILLPETCPCLVQLVEEHLLRLVTFDLLGVMNVFEKSAPDFINHDQARTWLDGFDSI
jgi:hypothetical protein